MNVAKIAKILRFELSVNLMSKSFIWGVAMLPLIICLTTLIGAGVGRLAVKNSTALPLGLVDKSGTFGFSGGPCEKSKIGQPTIFSTTDSYSVVNKKKESDPKSAVNSSVICFEAVGEAKTNLIGNKISQLIVIPQDFAETAKMQLYNKESDIFSEGISVFTFESFLRQQVIATFGVSEPMKKLIQGSSEYERYVLDSNGQFILEQEHSKSDAVSKTSSRLGLRLWGILIVLMSGSIGYGCTRTERTTKLIEIVLSSVTSAEYLLGKVIASTVVTISLITCWFGIGFVALNAMDREKEKLSGLSSIVTLLDSQSLWMIAFTVVGAICANLVGAAFGVLSKPNEEKSSTTLPFALLQQGGFILAMIVAVNPNSTIAFVTSFIPPISAPVMISRLGSGELTQIQIIIPMIVLALSAVLVMLIAARLMKLCLQLEGQRFNPIRILRAICS